MSSIVRRAVNGIAPTARSTPRLFERQTLPTRTRLRFGTNAICLGHAGRLANPGDMIAREVIGLPLLMMRDRDHPDSTSHLAMLPTGPDEILFVHTILIPHDPLSEKERACVRRDRSLRTCRERRTGPRAGHGVLRDQPPRGARLQPATKRS